MIDKANSLFDIARKFEEGDGVKEDIERAIALYQKAADQGHTEAQFNLGCILLHEEPQLAKELFLKATTTNFAPAQYELSLILSEEGDYSAAIDNLKASAEQGYIPACKKMGVNLIKEGKSDTISQGVKWLEKAIELGSGNAFQILGDFYLFGHTDPLPTAFRKDVSKKVIEPDLKKAVDWYEQGIQKDFIFLAYKLSRLYMKGEYLPRNLHLAEKWLLHAAYKGHKSSQQTLGREYASGKHFSVDADAAIYWLTQASDDFASALLEIGEIYLQGKLLPKDIEKAVEWFSKAAHSDSPYTKIGGLRALAKIYTQGDLGLIDLKKSDECNRQIIAFCEANLIDEVNPVFAFTLAEAYNSGLGVDKNVVSAVKYYRLAALLGHSKAREFLEKSGIRYDQEELDIFD